MGRKAGFKLSDEQKAKMQAGRKAKMSDRQGYVGASDEVPKVSKPKELTPSIVGYFFDKGDTRPYPVFSSEKKYYSNRMYKTSEEAKKAMKGVCV
jgi:hypothetical protein